MQNCRSASFLQNVNEQLLKSLCFFIFLSNFTKISHLHFLQVKEKNIEPTPTNIIKYTHTRAVSAMQFKMRKRKIMNAKEFLRFKITENEFTRRKQNEKKRLCIYRLEFIDRTFYFILHYTFMLLDTRFSTILLSLYKHYAIHISNAECYMYVLCTYTTFFSGCQIKQR